MAVYLFTFHAYRSWMPDHRRGFVQRGRGILPADAEMAANYARRARFERVRFDEQACRVLLNEAHRLCSTPARMEAGWRWHLGVAVFNHLHLLVSWKQFVEARRARAVLHRALTVALREARHLPPGRAVLSRGGSIKRVRDRTHYDHLVNTYLPSHRKYGGVILPRG